MANTFDGGLPKSKTERPIFSATQYMVCGIFITSMDEA